MQSSQSDPMVDGIIAGVIAGAVVVTWFFVADIVAGNPFVTPARLTSVVLGEEFQGAWPRLIVVFTILHFGIFISLGLAAVWLLRLMNLAPGITIGALFGVGVLNAVHYAGLLVTGTNLLTIIPVAHVIGANLLGGMLMMAYLHRAWRADTPLGWAVLRRYPLLYEGLGTGLVGAATVALWFFLLDLTTRTPFFTPAAIGSAILLSAQDASGVEATLGVIVAYSVLHIIVFLAVGVVFAWLASRVHDGPAIWLQSAVVLLLLEGVFLGSVGIASAWVMEAIGWQFALAGNLLAVLSMGGWIRTRRPVLRGQLTTEGA